MYQRKNSLDYITRNKILKGAIIAGGGAFVVAVAQYVSNQDFGQWTPFVVAMCSVIINAVKEYYSGE